ncbi:hypothetical protein CDQ71_00300 [Campylobacter hyointestinalis subsp. hyointestinalis]|uniref:hypothetical protein n=1 Tax=Campylobacter hyointestinalis TaxID=198 RepID=UPI000CE51958|nr:hypothetical protein [Campylobacter hyointestinalis]PPB58772.1 hypothetical protein CDQ71_00300 [Campylobacter hyointestinalis subsp. hyointestinalis]
MAAWFNPRAVTYNSNPALVAQSGAVGDALYKLYSDARANKQEQDRQNEIKRQFDTTFDEKQRQFNANQSLKEQEMADTKTYRDNNLKLQQDALAETKRNNDMYDAYRNAQLNSQNIYHNQMINLAKDKLATSSKSNPFFTKSLLENQSAMDNLGLTTDKIKQAYELGGDDGVQALYEATKNIAKGNKDLGLEVGIRQKNMPVSDRKDIKNIMTALEQAQELKNYVDNKGGWDKFGGLFDRLKTVVPNASTDGANYNALASNFATSASEVLKGQGKFNYENINENLEPSVLGTQNAQNSLNETQKMLIKRADELIKTAQAQNFIGADEAKENLDNYISKINNKPKEQELNDIFNANSRMTKR